MDYTYNNIVDIDLRSIKSAVEKSTMTNKNLIGQSFNSKAETYIATFNAALSAQDESKLTNIIDTAGFINSYLVECLTEGIFYEQHESSIPTKCPNGHVSINVYPVDHINRMGSGASPDGKKWNVYINNSGKLAIVEYTEAY